ncbi:MAG: hypothetical protein KA163_04945 [Bacteroidia bacterium]|nr:hypothetical protein [Bacteroidia bacterium]
MKKIVLIIFVVLVQNVFGQDTIYKTNGEIISSKIEEINPTVIKFRKFSNLTGPVYSESKSEILKIKFANGVVDTLTQVAEIKPQVINPTEDFQIKTSKPTRSLMYNNINDRDLLHAIQVLPISDSKNQMLKEYSKMMDYKRTQYLANGLGFGVGFAVPVVVTYLVLTDYNSYNYRNNPATTIIIGALAGAAIRITGQVLTKMNKNKRLNAKRNVIMLYDNLN